MKTIMKMVAGVCLMLATSHAYAQGIVINKTDGTKVYYKANEVQSVGVYGYEDEPEPVPEPAKPEVKSFTVKGIEFKMVTVEGGTFMMGSTQGEDDERPVHQVSLNSFAIGQTEVTQELWEAVMGSNPSFFKGSQRPVEKVSWEECQTFLTQLNSLTGRTFRLPTEAEWEYAALGGKFSKGYTYAGSNNIDEVGWYKNNSLDKGQSSPDYGTHNVGTKSPNELGLYDMCGNVFEWCQDWFNDKYYSVSPASNPTGPADGALRTERGGCWGNSAETCRTAYREWDTPTTKTMKVGLRLAL